jgi:hypothetical protein
MGYTSKYPTQDADHVKATTTRTGTAWYPYFATDPAKSLTGSGDDSCSWLSASGSVTNQRFHIDLGSAIAVKRIYYENWHDSGDNTNTGANNFTFWGSNEATAFAELTYATDTDWTQLTTSASAFDAHVNANQADPKYITVTNSTAYRYYAVKIADNQPTGGVGLFGYLGLRRLELQVSTTSAKTVNGLAIASVKTVNGLAIASVQSINGL